jgi:electron transport complex protein RnfD
MNEQYKLSVASSPHASSPVGTKNLMMDVVIALLPALCISIYFFGPRALTMTLVSVIACMFFEWAYEKIMKKPNTVGDMSAVITGILLVAVCPVTLPYWMIILGAFFAIVIVKQLFGGLGTNFLNPALAGRAFLMTTWIKPGREYWASVGSVVDIVTGATPLSADLMKSGTLPDASLMDMFIGNISGSMAEGSALMLLLGGIYMLIRGVIRIRIPAAYILTVAVLTFLFPRGGEGNLTWMLYELLAGGIMIGAFFMATDYVTSPNTPKGEIIYGMGCGLLTVFIRYFGGYPEGVCYSILLMNVCVWLIDKYTMPARYGVTSEMRKEAKAKEKAAKLAAKEADKA